VGQVVASGMDGDRLCLPFSGVVGLDRWSPLLWLAASLVLSILVTRWFSQRVAAFVMLVTASQSATLYVHFLLFLPGTLLHELSHWFSAKILGLRTGGMEFGPKVRRDGMVQMGAVKYQRADAVRESLVGLAPLISGSVVVLLLTYRRFGLAFPGSLAFGDIPRVLSTIWHTKDSWIWLYLLLAIGNTMFPSASDRRSWGILGLYLLITLGVLSLVGVLPHVPPTVVQWLLQRAQELAFSLGVTVLFDLMLGSLLWVGMALLGILLGRQVR